MTNNESNNKGFVGTGPYSPTTTFDKSLALRIDGGINAVSIAPSGRDVVLASKHGIYIVDLDDPYELPRFLEHQTPWQVADVQYSPHLETASWVISTSNQKALIWNLMRSAGNAIEHTLHGHYRAITDINWHPQNHNLLSTASVDTTVLAWDLRNSKKPIYKTADWRASASQVKWNLKNGNVLASSHDNYISLWDIRKGTKPFIQLKGHTSSVNNISFNPKNEFELMSSSNDGTIKIWNYKDDTYENYQKQNVATDFPVWRGRYLPFGEGFCAIPIVGGNNSVYLANNNGEENSKISPVYVFKGHNDRITDFLWRSRHQEQNIDDREFQLVTWSNDSDLRLWPIPETVYEKVNFSRKEPLDTPLIDYPYKTFSKDVKFNNKNLNVQDKIYKFPKEKFTTKSGRFVKEDIDHLSWLSGVRVDEDNIDNNNSNNNNNTVYDYFDDEDDYYMDEEGDESLYGNLGEEVAKVGSKFHMVSFEKISVSTGDIVVTLNGPWNSLNKDQLAFIRAIIHFDSKYPKGGPPKVRVEESREITNEQRLKMEQELSSIGKIYTDSKQNCLEQLLKFLLGEKVDMNPENTKKIRANVAEYDIMKNLGLDEEDIWNLEDIKNEKQSNVTGSEYTHEDGEEGEREYGNDDDDEDDDIAIDNPANIAKKKKFDSTPVPKGCGAVFSPNGQLVYFFTSTNSDKQKKIEDQIFNVSAGGIRGFGKMNKQESEKSDRDTVSTTGINNSSNEKKPKTYFESLELKNKKKEEYNKNNGKKNLGMGMNNFADEDEWDTILKSDLTFRTKISVAPDRAKERINMDAEYENPNSSHSTVTIQDYSHLIPDKKELALRYKTHGESLPLVCSHNAAVARQFNLHDIGTCWEMIGAMLKSKSKDLLKHEDWSYDIDGGRQFLNDVFQFFEKSHNVQMLALLSCILVASGRPEDIDNEGEDDILYVNGDVSFESNTYYNNSGKKIAHSRDSLLMRQNSIFSHSIHSNMNMSMHSNSHSSIHNGHIPNPIPGLKIDVLKSELLNNGNVYYPKTQKFIYNKLELLDKKREARCITYRDQYAELLYCWGFQAERSNILRFNINENSNEEYLRKIDEKDLFKGLEIVPTKPLRDRNCKVCDEPVVKRSFVCNKCGCLTHAECAKMWWDDKTGSSDNPCPSGCGCECLALYQKKI